MRRRISDRGRELFREYVRDVEEYWPGVQRMQADKLRTMIEHVTRAYGHEPDEVLAQVAEWAGARMDDRPAPVYITGLGGSGTNWLAAMLADLEGFAYAGEVYFPPRLLEQLASLGQADQGYVIDCVHLLHAWPRERAVAGARIVNSASRAFEAGLQKLWDPACTVVYMVRDPRDQVLSVTFRKPAYRKLHGAGRSDVDYLAFRCGSNRKSFERFEQVTCDFECRYEDLRDDTRRVFERLLARIGVQPPTDAVAETIYRHDAGNMRSGAVPRRGNLDEGGQQRGWRHESTPEQKQILHAELVEAIDGLGYEPDDCLGTPLRVDLDPRERTLSFPWDDPIGEVHLGAPDAGGWRWRRMGLAEGEVRIPAGSVAKLRVSHEFDPKRLRSLKLDHGDIQAICFAGNPRVTDSVLPLLRNIPGLREVDLARTRVTDAGMPHLGTITSLRGVNLWKTRVSPAAVRHLLGALPELHILGVAMEAELEAVPLP